MKILIVHNQIILLPGSTSAMNITARNHLKYVQKLPALNLHVLAVSLP